MLHCIIQDFLGNCRLADFSQRSLQALAIRLNEFTDFLKSQRTRTGVGPRQLIDIYTLRSQK